MDDLVKRARDLADLDARAGEPLGKHLRLMADRIEAGAKRIAALEAELASGSFYQEKDIDALMDRAEAAEARVKVLEEALRQLDKAASEVARHGAQTGPQWSKLTIASLKARAALKGEK